MSTLFNYLISKPKDQIQTDILPKISEENFAIICDNYITSKTIKKDEFETLVKLMSQHKQVIKLSEFVMKAINNGF